MPIRTIAIACSLVLGVAGCAPAVVDTSCTSFGPITYSARSDTDQTIRQVRQHNAAWAAICR